MAPQKTIEATKRTRRVPDEKVPAEIRAMYKDDTVEEVSLNFSTTADPDAEPVETETLFTVDGKDYRIPKEFGPSIAIIYLDVIDKGRDTALAIIMRTTIGKEGWAALLDLAERKLLTAPQVKALMEKVNVKIMGALEAMEGNS